MKRIRTKYKWEYTLSRKSGAQTLFKPVQSFNSLIILIPHPLLFHTMIAYINAYLIVREENLKVMLKALL